MNEDMGEAKGKKIKRRIEKEKEKRK